MQNLKQLMAFPMFASAIWLLWVLGLQTSPTGMIQVLAGLLLLGLAVWLLNNTESGASKFIAALSIVAATYLVIRLEIYQSDTVVSNSGSEPIPADYGFLRYDQQALAEALEDGPVFVNFTAAWCITCKVNEAGVLNTASVRQAMIDKGVTYLKADWTSEDSNITAALAEYGRGGVPLYLLYGRGMARAEVLPQMLTKGSVIDALNRL